jgi:phenylacetate-coenzyme A ligase PaaK-like adenylate-forming protein
MENSRDITRIFSIYDLEEFNDWALYVFKYQAENNLVYKEYIKLLGVLPSSVKFVNEIPFLPIRFFKNRNVVSFPINSKKGFFMSSGTGGDRSKHYYCNLNLYKQSILTGFKNVFGSPENYNFLFLLPSYQDNTNSSLLFMCKVLSEESNNYSQYLNPANTYSELIEKLKRDRHKTILLGTPFSLMDFSENHMLNSDRFVVMETGGMKGQRKEIVREALHQLLCNRFLVKSIASEYGMTELFSQAYSLESGFFASPPWMKVCMKEINDPFCDCKSGKTGKLAIIDLANFHSCSFILTDDIGKTNALNQFEVLGRSDGAEQRGCSLLMT